MSDGGFGADRDDRPRGRVRAHLRGATPRVTESSERLRRLRERHGDDALQQDE